MTRTYRRVRLIGHGGMGEVYEGRMELALGRELPCAIKLIRQDASADLIMQEMFGREAITMLPLNCPHLVRAHDFGVASDGRLFLVMELIQGPDLAAASDDLDHRVLRRVARDVLRAMQYLHRRGIVHRDISPRNILIDRSGVAKLGDLGIVKRASGTGPLALHGVPVYLAPELLRGHRPSAASDAYALGATLFERLTGKPPRDRHADRDDETSTPIVPESSPDDFKRLVRDLTRSDPDERLTVDRALVQLESEPALLADDDELTEFAGAWWDAHAEERAATPEATPLSLLGAVMQLRQEQGAQPRKGANADMDDAPALTLPPREHAPHGLHIDTQAPTHPRREGKPAEPRRRRTWPLWLLGVVLAAALGVVVGSLHPWQRSAAADGQPSLPAAEPAPDAPQMPQAPASVTESTEHDSRSSVTRSRATSAQPGDVEPSPRMSTDRSGRSGHGEASRRSSKRSQSFRLLR